MDFFYPIITTSSSESPGNVQKYAVNVFKKVQKVNHSDLKEEAFDAFVTDD